MSKGRAAGRGGRLVALLCAVALVLGCGGDPVRADLEAYERAVLTPLAEAERRTTGDLAAPLQELAAARLDARRTEQIYREVLIPRYRGLVELMGQAQPRTRELAELHGRLTAQYRSVLAELEQAAGALARGQWPEADAVHTRLAGLGFETVREEFARLAAAHGLDVRKN